MKEFNHSEMIRQVIKIHNEMQKNNRPINSLFYMKMYALMRLVYHIEPEYLDGLVLINHKNLDAPENKPYTGSIEVLFGLAGYNKITKKLVVYEDNISYQMPEKEEEQTDEEYFTEKFFITLHTILHEYEHVFVEREMKEENDEEAIFLRTVDQIQETIDTYNFSPNERLAELRSLELILTILEQMGLKEHKLYEQYSNKRDNILKSGYYFEDANGYETTKEEGTFTSPSGRYARMHNIDTEKFLEVTDCIEDNKVRLQLGLPLSEQEYYSSVKSNSYTR